MYLLPCDYLERNRRQRAKRYALAGCLAVVVHFPKDKGVDDEIAALTDPALSRIRAKYNGQSVGERSYILNRNALWPLIQRQLHLLAQPRRCGQLYRNGPAG